MREKLWSFVLFRQAIIFLSVFTKGSSGTAAEIINIPLDLTTTTSTTSPTVSTRTGTITTPYFASTPRSVRQIGEVLNLLSKFKDDTNLSSQENFDNGDEPRSSYSNIAHRQKLPTITSATASMASSLSALFVPSSSSSDSNGSTLKREVDTEDTPLKEEVRKKSIYSIGETI